MHFRNFECYTVKYLKKKKQVTSGIFIYTTRTHRKTYLSHGTQHDNVKWEKPRYQLQEKSKLVI